MRIREKRRIVRLLQQEDFASTLAELRQLPPADVLSPLFAGICHANATIRWHAISAMGWVVAALAQEDMEAARVVMRRFMWSLNDESGGIGWGAPEAMAEIMVRHADLAQEYCHILVSFMREDGFFIEHPPLQRGLMWGIGRLASKRPDLLRERDVVRYLLPYAGSEDAEVRGLAARALGFLQAKEGIDALVPLRQDPEPVKLYDAHSLRQTTVGELASAALAAIKRTHCDSHHDIDEK